MIFVMGAAGSAGHELIPLLVEGNIDHRMSIGPHSRTTLETADAAVRVDYEDDASLEKALRGCESLFLLTPFTQEQFTLEMRIVSAAKRAGVEKIVKQSVPGTEGMPDFGLGEQHRNIEEFIEKLGFRFTFLRPHPFMQDFVVHHGAAIRSDDRFLKPEGGGAVSYVDSRDVAAVAVEALVSNVFESQKLFLTGAEALTNLEVAAIFSRVLEREITYADVRPGMAVDSMRAADMSDESIAIVMALHPFEKTPLAARTTDAVRRVLRRDPIRFEQFVADHRTAFEREQAAEYPQETWKPPATTTEAPK